MTRTIVAFALVVILAGCESKNSSTVGAAKTYSREEFRKLVMGKTPDEVLKAVGKPNSTTDYSTGDSTWFYYNLTIDPITGKQDSLIHVSFSHGRVNGVAF